MLRVLYRIAAGLVVAVLLVYLVDWAVWHLHVAQGAGMDHVQVSRVVVAPLKGSKEEYYFDGTMDVACTRSMFPLPTQGWSSPCWWLRNHRTVETRY